MENISIEALEKVLPRNTDQQNDVLKRLILTLKSKFNEQALELQKTKDQLCITCQSQNSKGGDALLKKDLNAAVAKVASMQADYDALVAHFTTIREKHSNTLVQLQQLKQENDSLRLRNAELVNQIQTQQVDLSRFNELQLMLTNCQIEKQKLEELQAKTYAAQLSQQEKINQLTTNSSQATVQLQNKITQLELKLTEFDTYKAENQRLREEINQLFIVTSACSVQDLSAQISKLKQQNQDLRLQVDGLHDRVNEQRLQEAAAIEVEKKKALQQAEQAHDVQIKQLRNSYEQLLNQQNLEYQKQLAELAAQLREAQANYTKTEAEAKAALHRANAMQQQLTSEKQIFENARERAKKRNVVLNEQLSEYLQLKDELEIRLQQCQEQLLGKDQEIQELKLLNKQFQRQSETVFLQLRDVQAPEEPVLAGSGGLDVQTSKIQLKESQIQAVNSELNRVIKIEDEEIVQYDSKRLNLKATLIEFDDTRYPRDRKLFINVTVLDEMVQSCLFDVESVNDQVMDKTIDLCLNDECRENLQSYGMHVKLIDQNGDMIQESGLDCTEMLQAGECVSEMELAGVRLIFELIMTR